MKKAKETKTSNKLTSLNTTEYYFLLQKEYSRKNHRKIYGTYSLSFRIFL